MAEGVGRRQEQGHLEEETDLFVSDTDERLGQVDREEREPREQEQRERERREREQERERQERERQERE